MLHAVLATGPSNNGVPLPPSSFDRPAGGALRIAGGGDGPGSPSNNGTGVWGKQLSTMAQACGNSRRGGGRGSPSAMSQVCGDDTEQASAAAAWVGKGL
jgi:hypothetical protein